MTGIECVRCHTSLPENSKFCSSCGWDVTGGAGTVSGSAIESLHQRLERVLQGRYRVERLLGKGGMACVFLAHDLTLEREVAIKVLPPDVVQDPQVVRRFQQEAKTAAKLDHQNIIPIYRVETEADLNYFVMKYVAGTSLEDTLERKELLPVEYIQRVLWEAACALGHAHQRGVVHRDVKPANIMFDYDGRVMLTDFGISKALQAASGFTGTGMIIGTPHYMAPEQAKGAAVDGRADQYSLGVVGYRMVTRQLPFSGDSVHTILYKHIFEEPRPAQRGDVPAGITSAIARALAKDPTQRFSTMEEFATAVWPEQPVRSPAAPKTTPPRRFPVQKGGEGPTEVAAAPTTPLPVSHVTGAPPAARRRVRGGVVVGVLLVAGALGGYAVWAGRGGAAPAAAIDVPAARATVNVVQVAPTDITLQVGERTGLSATVFDQEGRLMAGADIRWTSGNERVAWVDANGRVTGLAAGTTLVAARSGNREAQTRVEVRAAAAVRPPNRPPPAQAARGFITVNTEPPGMVFIDGREVGQTPVVEFDVPPGPHTIRVERPGFRTVSERVRVAGGQTIRKRWVLQEGSE